MEVVKEKLNEISKKDSEQDNELKEHAKRLNELEKSDSKQCTQLEYVNTQLSDVLGELKDNKKIMIGYLVAITAFLIKFIFFK